MLSNARDVEVKGHFCSIQSLIALPSALSVELQGPKVLCWLLRHPSQVL
jgi:hypothetical protein